MFKVGDIILVCSTYDSPEAMSEYQITSIGKNTLKCGDHVFYTAFCWPVRVKQDLLNILQIRQELKKRYDDSVSKIYELRNKLGR